MVSTHYYCITVNDDEGVIDCNGVVDSSDKGDNEYGEKPMQLQSFQ